MECLGLGAPPNLMHFPTCRWQVPRHGFPSREVKKYYDCPRSRKPLEHQQHVHRRDNSSPPRSRSSPSQPQPDWKPRPASCSPPSPAAKQPASRKQLAQPWRSWWPCERGSDVYKFLEENHPEVFQFVFHPDRMFHHPWKAWKGKGGPLIVNPAPGADSSMRKVVTARTVAGALPECGPYPRDALGSSQVEALIEQHLQYSWVRPKSFYYLAPLEEYCHDRLYTTQLPSIPGKRMTNLAQSSYPVKVYDLANQEHLVSLEDAGFQYIDCNIPIEEWTERWIEGVYLHQVSQYLVKLLGAEIVVPYSFKFRHHSAGKTARPWPAMRDTAHQSSQQAEPVDRSDGPAPGPSSHPMARSPSSYGYEAAGTARLTTEALESHNTSDPDGRTPLARYLYQQKSDDPWHPIESVKAAEPFFRVHCDAGANTHRIRMPHYFPDNYEELQQKRVRLLSLWRPLTGPNQDTPMAFCDYRTLSRGDLVPMDIVYPERDGGVWVVDEVYEVLHNERHRWFYKRGMSTDEAVLFKLYDTDDREATISPHSAFVDPTVPGDTPPRSSLEIKLMIIG